MSYIRFQTSHVSSNTGKAQGLFAAYWFVKESGALDESSLAVGAELYDWFKSNVPDPSLYATGNDLKAVTWWKAGADEVVERARELADVVRTAGLEVSEVSNDRPGQVVYEDEFQVAVVD